MTLILVGIVGYIINQYLLNDDIDSSNGIHVITNNYLSEISSKSISTSAIKTPVIKPDIIDVPKIDVPKIDVPKIHINIPEQLKKL